MLLNGKNKQDIIFLIASILLIAGAISYIAYPNIAPYIFSIGAALIIFVRIKWQITSKDFRVKRLLRMQQIGSTLYILTAYLMFTQNKYWIASLCLSTIFELIVAFRIPNDKQN